MGAAFSESSDDFRLKLVKNIQAKNVQNADEIVSAIKEYRIELAERILELEANSNFTVDNEVKFATLIRQDQYLEYLLSLQKCELAEMFVYCVSNCVVPDVFQWYKK